MRDKINIQFEMPLEMGIIQLGISVILINQTPYGNPFDGFGTLFVGVLIFMYSLLNFLYHKQGGD